MTAKVLTVLLSPLASALLLGLMALGLSWWRPVKSMQRLAWWLVSFALLWLWIWSTPLASDALRGWIEDHAGPRTLEAVPAAPVIVVLGGGVSGPRLPQRPYPDLGDSADRIWHAARLYHAGKAPKLLLSGGVVRTGDGTEAEAMQRFLNDLGVPASAITLEDGSDNTASNAQLTASKLASERIDTVILVTSALHMPRARAAFEQAGLKVLPAPTDFEVVDMPLDLLQWLPSAGALSGSAQGMKELVGWMISIRLNIE